MRDWNEEEPRTLNKKKNTRTNCKGKKGVPHAPEMVMHHAFNNSVERVPPAWILKRRPDYLWMCHHEYKCKNCGKYLESVPWKDCPNKPEGL